MAERSDPDTTRFPAIPAPAVAAAASAAPRSRRGAGALWLLLVLVAVIIGAGSWLLLSVRDPGAPEPAPPAPVTVTETAPVEAPEADTGRPVRPELPAGATPANDAARAGTDAGDLNNVYTGSTATSAEFARAVRDAFVSHYLDSGELNATVAARSPVTGTVYSMRCTDNGDFITCRGGENAVVYIA